MGHLSYQVRIMGQRSIDGSHKSWNESWNSLCFIFIHQVAEAISLTEGS